MPPKRNTGSSPARRKTGTPAKRRASAIVPYNEQFAKSQSELQSYRATEAAIKTLSREKQRQIIPKEVVTQRFYIMLLKAGVVAGTAYAIARLVSETLSSRAKKLKQQLNIESFPTKVNEVTTNTREQVTKTTEDIVNLLSGLLPTTPESQCALRFNVMDAYMYLQERMPKIPGVNMYTSPIIPQVTRDYPKCIDALRAREANKKAEQKRLLGHTYVTSGGSRGRYESDADEAMVAATRAKDMALLQKECPCELRIGDTRCRVSAACNAKSQEMTELKKRHAGPEYASWKTKLFDGKMRVCQPDTKASDTRDGYDCNDWNLPPVGEEGYGGSDPTAAARGMFNIF